MGKKAEQWINDLYTVIELEIEVVNRILTVWLLDQHQGSFAYIMNFILASSQVESGTRNPIERFVTFSWRIEGNEIKQFLFK